MYSSRSNLILGFHGCDQDDQQKLVNDPSLFKKSEQDYDWLGHGMYFWENNEKRALDWAKMKKNAGTLNEPSYVGAVINLGYCLDLLDSSGIEILKRYYQILKTTTETEGYSLPKNINHPKEHGNDRTLRKLDCAVIELIHSELEKADKTKFDSVRALFIEGNPIYPEAGFYDKTHIQICIRNPNCIKGIFIPRKKTSEFSPV